MTTNTPYTQKQFAQFRGPQNSDEYNENQEDNFKDLSYLYNKLAQVDSDQDKGTAAFLKELLSAWHMVNLLDARLSSLETNNARNTVNFVGTTMVDNDRFNATVYNINAVDRLNYDSFYNISTLPKVTASSVSKIRFINNDGTFNVPASLQTYVAPISPSVEANNPVIETSQPYNAIVASPGKVWERNVIASTTDDVNGAQMYFYVSIPNELSTVADTNCIIFHPYPSFAYDVLEIAYTIDVNVDLTTASNWTVFNSDQIYYQNSAAVGDIIPGGWSGDALINSGPKVFYFTPRPITAIRFKMRQVSNYVDNIKPTYTYGLSKLDIRYDKFLDTGKMIVKCNAPSGKTISSITSVTPYIYNIPEYQLNDVFSYRAIWETSFNSGTYTLTPVASSQRVWLEITLNKNVAGTTPMMSGLVLKFS